MRQKHFRGNYYELFYAFHPSVFVFLDNKVKLQATTYNQLRSTHALVVRRKYVSETEHLPCKLPVPRPNKGGEKSFFF